MTQKKFMQSPKGKKIAKRKNAYRRIRYNNDPEYREKILGHHVRWKYGLSRDEYLALFLKQSGKCAICGFGAKKLHIDHDHNTGSVRGLLCVSCNTILGKYERDPVFFSKMQIYLKEQGDVT